MREKNAGTGKKKVERGSTTPAEEKFILRLYIVRGERKSVKAVRNLSRLCEKHLAGRYELEVIDIREHPTLAQDEQIIATPTLIKKLPEPLRKFVGDMSDKEKILLGIDLRPEKQ